jgi:prepilin-type processing-associated H-X9-DG protein
VTLTHPTAEEYARIFAEECARTYPVIDALEVECGYAIDRDRLEDMARVLACPMKANAPNWQHGRVLYAVVRRYLAGKTEPVTVLDIGTAKGFSALCLQMALNDAGALGAVVSVDVIDPDGRVRRNTVAEVDGPLTLAETLAPWPMAGAVTFLCSSGVEWLDRHPGRVHVAFVDGKHSGPVVHKEGLLLAQRQNAGDIVVFDDVHIPGVRLAVDTLEPFYAVRQIDVMPHRSYAIAVRQ